MALVRPCTIDLPEVGEICDVVIEYPRWSAIKRRSDGSLDFISPVPCPYNYGSILGRWGDDGDALDAVLLGPRLPLHTRLRCPVVGVIGFLDEGIHDPKVICSQEPLQSAQRRNVELFFRLYARFKHTLAAVRRRRGATQYLGWLR